MVYTRSPRWLGNIKPENAGLIAQAATETGFNVYVDGIGVDPATGQPAFSDTVAIKTGESQRDHSPFWAAYHRLEKAATEQEE